MIDHRDDIMDAGIDCIKLEGRAKSAYYAAIVTTAYRHVLDAVAEGKPVDPAWRNEVDKVSHRHYSTGFYYGQPGQYFENSRYLREYQVCGIIQDCTPDGLATVSLRNKFATGDEMDLIGPGMKSFTMQAPQMQTMEGETLLEPKNPQMLFKMQLPQYMPPLSIVRHEVDLSGK